MKADPEHQLRLLDLQEIDSTLERLEHRARNLPELGEVAQLDARLVALRDSVTALDTELEDIAREQRKAEADVEQVRSRAQRDQSRLDSGQVSSPKELESLQSEISSLHGRQQELEETVLEVMERREAAESRRAEYTAELETLTGQREAAEERRSTAMVDIETEQQSARDRRARVVAELPEELLSLYTKLRDSYAGIGAAPLQYGRCQGCKLALSTAELSEIRTAAADEVLRCEECRRILVRTMESGL